MSTNGSLVPEGYAQFLTDLKAHVRSARVQVQRIVNTALIDLYWNIGTRILAEQNARAGEAPSSTGWPRTCAGNSRK